MISQVILILVLLSKSTDGDDESGGISGHTEQENNNIPSPGSEFIHISGPDGDMNVTLNPNDTSSSDEEDERVKEKHNRMPERNLFSVNYYPKSGDIPLLNRKVFRGMRVTIMEHPYIASIRRNYSHYLTGTILTRNLVLTVAHPLRRVPIYELGVVVGENYNDRGTNIHAVLLVVIHLDFNDQTLDNDIAILRIYPDMMYTMHVKPILLYLWKKLQLNHTAFVTGWGRCDWNGEEMCLPRYSAYYPEERVDPMLRTVAYKVEGDSVFCSSYSKLGLKLSPGMLCLGPAREQEETAPCLAVPGAPLVVDARLLGILSWGFGCGYHDDQPLIYTDLRKYNAWLENIAYKLDQLNVEYEKMYEATMGYVISQILIQTRIKKPEIHHHDDLELEPMPCDEVLALIDAKIYDIRDYIDHRHFHSDKKELYMSLRMKKVLLDKTTISDVGGFLPEDINSSINMDSEYESESENKVKNENENENTNENENEKDKEKESDHKETNDADVPVEEDGDDDTLL